MRSVFNTLTILTLMIFVMSCGFLTGDDPPENANENLENVENAANEEANSTPTTTTSAQKTKNVRVRFSRGSTMRTYRSTIPVGGNHTYSLTASKGQVMKVEVGSTNNNAKFKVIDPSGSDLRGYSNSSFSQALPADGTYKVVITSDANVAYNVGFNVSAVVKATPTATPQQPSPPPPAATPKATAKPAGNANTAPVPKPT